MIMDGATTTIGDFFDHDPNNQEKIEVSFSCCRLSRRSCGRNYTWIVIEKNKKSDSLFLKSENGISNYDLYTFLIHALLNF